MIRATWIVLAATVACAAPASRTAPQPAPQALAWDADDSARVASLETTGRRMAGSRVVVLAQPEEISETWQAALVDSLDRDVAELRALIGSHSWQSIDDRPIRTVQFPSNFQLSTARAQAARALISRALGDSSRISAEGRGEANPLKDNATPEGRERPQATL